MKKNLFKKPASFRRAILPASVIAAMTMAGSASAFEIDSGNPDIKLRWDNTFRYNAGWRTASPKWDLIKGGSNVATEKKFGTGDMINNRLDVLSEFDFVYKESTGFRVSAAGWYDKRYDNDYLPGSGGNFPGSKYPDEIKRYYNGPSGEFLDAFVFTQFNFGDVPVDIKLGQHTVYWGETLFSLADGISSGQSYADLRKAASTPGIEAKELFKPLDQFSFSAALSPELTIIGQYFFDTKIDLFPLGGTLFGPIGGLTFQGTTTNPAGAGTTWDGVHYNGLKKSGDWGAGAKWHPKWLDGTAGFYYRYYTPKNSGALAKDPSTGMFEILMDPAAPKTRLYGFSLAKQVWGVSWGMDLTYRKNANLAYRSFLTAPSQTGWLPYGNVYTATFSGIAYFGNTALYDSAVLTGELDYDGLDKVTGNFNNLNNRGNGCRSGLSGVSALPTKGYYGCPTGQSFGINVLFEPKWFQVFQGVDLSMPLFYSIGLKGNSPVPNVAQNEGMGSYSIGVTADVNALYNFQLKYNGTNYKREARAGVRGGAGFVGSPFSNAALGDSSDKGRITFTAKATW